MDKKMLNKKVWVLDDKYQLKDNTLYTIVGIHTRKEVNHWCDIIDIKDETYGKVVSVDEYRIVIPLDETIEDKVERIEKYLSDNEVYPCDTNIEGDYVVVDIDWGDWKHEHLWCTDLMGFIGYCEVNEVVTEEDGSDCYSAKHYYLKKAE